MKIYEKLLWFNLNTTSLIDKISLFGDHDDKFGTKKQGIPKIRDIGQGYIGDC